MDSGTKPTLGFNDAAQKNSVLSHRSQFALWLTHELYLLLHYDTFRISSPFIAAFAQYYVTASIKCHLYNIDILYR